MTSGSNPGFLMGGGGGFKIKRAPCNIMKKNLN